MLLSLRTYTVNILILIKIYSLLFYRPLQRTLSFFFGGFMIYVYVDLPLLTFFTTTGNVLL